MLTIGYVYTLFICVARNTNLVNLTLILFSSRLFAAVKFGLHRDDSHTFFFLSYFDDTACSARMSYPGFDQQSAGLVRKAYKVPSKSTDV